jgi:hypothetical protein
MSTNVPQPTLGPNGYIAPSEEAILAGVQEDIDAAFGADLDFGDITNPTPQGQLAATQAAEIGNVNNILLWFTNNVDPAYASGRMQDAIGRIYYITRNPALPTVLQITCIGLPGVNIPLGALIQDLAGNIYTCTQAGQIPVGGSITLAFANLLPGPIAVPETVIIYQSISGWDSATVSSGVVGVNTESRSAFEARRSASTAQNASGQNAAVLGAVLSVPGVLDAYVIDNPTNAPVTIGGYTLAANSLYVGVVGGAALAVAQAIWSRKNPGPPYNGNTTVTVYDTSPVYAPPGIPYSVTFETPAALPILFSVVLATGPNVPANAAALVQNAIMSAFAGGDGGPRARMGSTLYASRYYAPVAALGPWVQIIDIEIGGDTPLAVFTGSITGDALTVASVSSGTIAIGQTINDATGMIPPGTTIVSGSGSSWVLSWTAPSPVSSETIKAYLPNQFKAVAGIAQEPAISAANIAVTVE